MKKDNTHYKGYDYPMGIFYRRACEMMGIDPDNNPNYKDLRTAGFLGIER